MGFDRVFRFYKYPNARFRSAKPVCVELNDGQVNSKSYRKIECTLDLKTVLNCVYSVARVQYYKF